ncbi:MAG: 5-formyltetrahydrofolate cyclo-ligase [Polyangiaceae bacterium]
MTGEDLVQRSETSLAKQELRERARRRRASMSPSEVAPLNQRIERRLLARPEIAQAQTVALFWPIARLREVDLRGVDAVLRQRGCQIAYPFIEAPGLPMVFRRLDEVGSLVPSRRGFEQPEASAPLIDRIDVIVVPGLLFDAAGFRVGYGGGYYDGALPRYRPPAVAIGVCYEMQLCEVLPRSDHDVAVDTVITDEQEIGPIPA